MKYDYEKALNFYKSLNIKELRKRQDLCRKQLVSAVKQNHEESLIHLQKVDSLLIEAIDFVEFEK